MANVQSLHCGGSCLHVLCGLGDRAPLGCHVGVAGKYGDAGLFKAIWALYNQKNIESMFSTGNRALPRFSHKCQTFIIVSELEERHHCNMRSESSCWATSAALFLVLEAGKKNN